MATGRKVYVFADESGNFDFRSHTVNKSATRYFSVGTLVVIEEPTVQLLREDLSSLREDLAGKGYHIPCGFHASEDQQAVRNEVYAVLGKHELRFDVTLLEKAKAQPQTRTTPPTFFQYAWFYHFKMLVQRVLRPGDELVVVAASIGTKKMRAAFRAAVQEVVTQCVDYRIPRKFACWDVGTDPCLQAADYGLWAVSRKWEHGDSRAILQIPGKVASQFDLWERGTKFYY